MLDDAAIEWFSRQILLPEVGGRGQERLCATVATVRGDGDAAAFAATLLQAAGVRVVVEAGAAGRLEASVDITSLGAGVIGVVGEACATVATLVGRPCIRCASSVVPPSPENATVHPADAQTLGALVAAETLRAALGLAREGRVQEIDLARGAFTARPLPATPPCPDCPPAGA
jgi:molybdopterin/thiamine biosynthesis adenylyltransferase